MFYHALVPLQCPLVRCSKNLYWRKAMPQTYSVIKGKSAVQEIHCHAMFLVGCETLKEKIAGFFIPQDLLNDIFPTSSSIWWRGFRLKTLYEFLPCTSSFAVPCRLFPPQHLTFWVIQQVLNKQPCHPYMCSFHVFLCMVRVLKTVWIGHVSKGRDGLHHFSHSSVKSVVICKSCCNSWCHCSFTKFLWLVLG